MFCAKFGWNWHSGSGKEDLKKKIVNVFLLFHNYLPLEKGRALHLNKIESPSPMDALCQVWMKLVLNIFKFHQWIFAISKSSPLGKGQGPSFQQTWIPLPMDALCQVWLKLPRGFLRRFFLISSMYFCFLVIISTWNGAGLFISTNLTQGCFVPSLVEIGPVVLE